MAIEKMTQQPVKEEKGGAGGEGLSVTFAIPVLNEEDRLTRCLDSIRAQEYPPDNVEIIVADAGSTDRTRDIAREFGSRVLDNPDVLAEFGLKKAMLHVETDLAVVFAADNELPDARWLKRVTQLFGANKELAAVWGRIIASDDDSPVNKYYALIQNDPLTYFVNKNLGKYLLSATHCDAGELAYLFRVDPEIPLPWGANGLVYRTGFIKPVWDIEGYLGDNDAFQSMVARGHDAVAYMPGLTIYHHCLRSLRDWKEKYERNFSRHFIQHYESRDMSWAFPSDFTRRFFLWLIYSLFVPVSLLHSMYLALRDRDAHWLYHAAASFLQAATYIKIVLLNRDARRVVKSIVFNRESRESTGRL